jgi:hypothetical protein
MAPLVSSELFRYCLLMTAEELHARMKAYTMGWKEVGEYLEAERRARVRRADTATSLELLRSAFNSAVWLHPPHPSSGLVEQQAIFARARR